MAQVIGLGHVGIYVRDLQRMVTFYRDTLGLRVTKQNWRAGIVFLSADPEGADHEIALFRGRPDGERAGVATVGLNDGKADAFRRTQHRYPSFTEPTPPREMSPTLDLVLF